MELTPAQLRQRGYSLEVEYSHRTMAKAYAQLWRIDGWLAEVTWSAKRDVYQLWVKAN